MGVCQRAQPVHSLETLQLQGALWHVASPKGRMLPLKTAVLRGPQHCSQPIPFWSCKVWREDHENPHLTWIRPLVHSECLYLPSFVKCNRFYFLQFQQYYRKWQVLDMNSIIDVKKIFFTFFSFSDSSVFCQCLYWSRLDSVPNRETGNRFLRWEMKILKVCISNCT